MPAAISPSAIRRQVQDLLESLSLQHGSTFVVIVETLAALHAQLEFECVAEGEENLGSDLAVSLDDCREAVASAFSHLAPYAAGVAK